MIEVADIDYFIDEIGDFLRLQEERVENSL